MFASTQATLTGMLAALPSPPFDEIVLGPFRFRMYGLCIALGVLAAIAIARRRFSDRGGDPDDITTIAIVGVPAGLVGARLYHVITDFPDLYSDGRWWPDAFFVWQGGLGIPGAVLGGAIAVIITCRVMDIDWRVIADAAAPAIPVAQAIGRLGNWFNQELYGGPTTLPWGLDVDAAPGFPPETLFHPTFAYEALWNLALAGLIVLLGRSIVLRSGRWFAVYVAGYGLGRLWVESLRIDAANEILGLRVNTWVSMIAILGGLIWLFWDGSPVDRSATAQLRSGVGPRGADAAATPAHEDDAESPDEAGPADDPERADEADSTESEPDSTGSEDEPADGAQSGPGPDQERD